MNKTAVVIGAGSGLGFGLAKKFKNEGFKVVLVARNEHSLKEMTEQLGEDVFYKTADASDATNLNKTIEEIKNEYGTPDVVLYNVGITAPDSDNLTTDTLVEHFKADVAGAYTTATYFSDDKFSENSSSAKHIEVVYAPATSALKCSTRVSAERLSESGVVFPTLYNTTSGVPYSFLISSMVLFRFVASEASAVL